MTEPTHFVGLVKDNKIHKLFQIISSSQDKEAILRTSAIDKKENHLRKSW